LCGDYTAALTTKNARQVQEKLGRTPCRIKSYAPPKEESQKSHARMTAFAVDGWPTHTRFNMFSGNFCALSPLPPYGLRRCTQVRGNRGQGDTTAPQTVERPSEGENQGALWRARASHAYFSWSKIGEIPRVRRASTCIHAPLRKRPASGDPTSAWAGAMCTRSGRDGLGRGHSRTAPRACTR
jgi:hypothetical protein